MVERETVVVDGDNRSSYGWLVALGIIALIVILFFAFGGANLFNGTDDATTNPTVDTSEQETTPIQPETTQPETTQP